MIQIPQKFFVFYFSPLFFSFNSLVLEDKGENTMFTLFKFLFRTLFKTIKFFSLLLTLVIIASFLINGWLILTTNHNLTTLDNAHEEKTYALVLGASILPDKTPSPILKERLDGAIDLYQKGLVKKIILSGGSKPYYDEVSSMYHYALNNGIPPTSLIRDNEGISTEYSINNYFEAYQTTSLYIVTQKIPSLSKSLLS